MKALLRRITKLEDRRGLTEPVKIIHLPPSKNRPSYVQRPDGSWEIQAPGTASATNAVTPGVEAWPR